MRVYAPSTGFKHRPAGPMLSDADLTQTVQYRTLYTMLHVVAQEPSTQHLSQQLPPSLLLLAHPVQHTVPAAAVQHGDTASTGGICKALGPRGIQHGADTRTGARLAFSIARPASRPQKAAHNFILVSFCTQL